MDTLFKEPEISGERKQYLEKMRPWIRFQIQSKLVGWKYQTFLAHLLHEFVISQDPRKDEFFRVGFDREPEREGGLSDFRFSNGEFFIGCKLYWMEYTTNHSWLYKRQKGILFRDHESFYDTYKIYRLADEFEKFLRSKKIRFRRFGIEHDGKEQVLQSKYRC